VPSRPQRRQGVIYGPPRPPEGGRDSGAILGRVLGVLVIVLAVGVLGGGAVVLLGGAAVSSATPSPSADPSVLPSGASPTPALSTIPPTAGPSLSPTPSPSPTPFVPTVQVGPGFVTFGTRSDADLNIVDARSAFRPGETITWSAHLSEPANSADLQVRVLKLDPDVDSGERLISESGVRPRVEGGQRFERKIRPARALDGPGIYVVRYMRGEAILSEGYFLVEQ